MGINVFKLSWREFFSGHFKTKDFLFFKFKKKKIFWSIVRDFTCSPESSSSEAVSSARRLIFWPVKIKRFRLAVYLL
jgi:hypothetical protein